MAHEKMYIIPAEDPAMVNLFKGRLTDDPTLDSAVKFMSRKMDILKNPKTSQSFKKQAIKQIDPDIEIYIKNGGNYQHRHRSMQILPSWPNH